MSMAEKQYALHMRDVISRMVKEALNRERPKYRYAIVNSIDRTNRKANVTFNGDPAPVQVNMGVVQPSAVGQTVRVEGIGTDKFITDVKGIAYVDLENQPSGYPGYDVNATASTLVYRGTGGRTNVGTPTSSANAATKGYVDQEVGGVKQPPVIGRYSKGTSQSTAASTWTPITWPTVVREDMQGYATYRTSTQTFTIPATGWYRITAQVTWVGSTTGRRAIRLTNGATVFKQAWDAPNTYTAVGLVSSRLTDTYYFAAGTLLEVQVWQDSGGALSTEANAALNILSIEKVSTV